jgi:hypothetical protein
MNVLQETSDLVDSIGSDNFHWWHNRTLNQLQDSHGTQRNTKSQQAWKHERHPTQAITLCALRGAAWVWMSHMF